jgi:predicted SAM-dependent methyltransferase
MKTRKIRSNRSNQTNGSKQCDEAFCTKFYPGYLVEKLQKIFKDKKVSVKNLTKKERQGIIQECKDAYCNPDCKGTILESGKTLSKEYIAKLQTSLKGKKHLEKKVIKAMKTMRNMVFKNKTNVLKKGFYEKMNVTKKKLFQKRGAISGCSL